MKNFFPDRYCLYLLPFLLGIAGCSGVKPSKTAMHPSGNEISMEESPAIKGAPDWVNKGSRLLATTRGAMFYGVAVAVPMGDMALQKAVADDRARAEVTRVLTAYLDAVSAEYIAAVSPPGAVAKNAEMAQPLASAENVSSRLGGSIKSIITNTRIIGSWREPSSSNIWSIAELDIKHVKNTVAEMDGINADLKRYIEAEAGNIFEGLVNARRRADDDN